MSLLVLCQWLEDTALSNAIRESSWAFPTIESIHVFGLCLFGIAVLMDFRVLKMALSRVTVAELAQLTPWATAGIIVMLVSGGLTFLNAPVDYYNNTLFRIKLLLLLLVGFNAWLLRAGVHRHVAVARGLSLLLWGGVVIAGRMITYHLLGPQ
jgi:hypothetical protein